VHTSNTAVWGTTRIFVDGVSVPDPAAFQQRLISQTGPGKRLPDLTEPLIIAKDGKIAHQFFYSFFTGPRYLSNQARISLTNSFRGGIWSVSYNFSSLSSSGVPRRSIKGLTNVS